MARDPLCIGRVPAPLLAALDAHASQHATTRSAILRDALTSYLAPLEESPSPATATREAATSTPRPRPRRKTTPSPCTHRVKPGAFCRRCNAII